MKKQLIRVSPLQTGKVAAALYFIMSLPLLLLMMVPAGMAGNGFAGLGWMLLCMPVLYAIFGFIFTVFGAWIYNLVAARIGGIEYTSVEV